MKRIKSMYIVLVLMVSIYSLALADAGVENFEVSFEFEAKNEIGNGPHNGK